MKVITKDHKVREELAYIPAKLFVKEYNAEVCKCENAVPCIPKQMMKESPKDIQLPMDL